MELREAKTILLIEDNEGIADALTLLLEIEGYYVDLWMGEPAELRLQEPLPDLILLDLLLGGMDGSILCQQLKAEDRTRQIPVILMSANPHTREIARAVGADDEVMKPFDPTQLLALLSTYLNRE
jgi:DNA-binding response OmpR family regulator